MERHRPTIVIAPADRKKGRLLSHHLRKEKRFLKDQVRQREKMALLGQFTTGAAHEINNPLAIISAHAQHLLSRMEEGKVSRDDLREIRDTLHLVDREVRYCGGIIKNLLTFTHTRGVKKGPISLGDIVDDSLKIMERQLKLSRIAVRRRIEPGLPPILGNANLIQQVLMNLIWNAQVAMSQGGILQIGATRSENRHVELTVKDSGVGIPKENLDKIFTPFFTTKEVGKGTGLGLWVVHSIVEAHQGKVEVASRVGRGTTFTIGFPAYH